VNAACIEREGRRLYGPPPFAGIGPKYMPPDPTEYNPRHDPEYADRLLNDLIEHRLEWRKLHRLYGGNCETVREAVALGRRAGLVIEGDRRLGYRFVCFRRRREGHLHALRASVWPVDGSEERDHNQLSIDDVEE
jgi:hypothetical protein